MTMKRILNYKINLEDDGKTVRAYLSALGYSHAVFVQLKKSEKGIVVNGRWYYVNDILHTDDLLTISLLENVSSPNIIPIAMNLDIIYEDDDILILNKPSNTPIHPSLNNYQNTLANGVLHYYNSQNISYTFRCINRLDRDTTGLTIIAKHMLSGAVLSRQMVNRDIHREYLAIVEGLTDISGTICAPIGRKSCSTIERCIDEINGEHAVTHYNRIEYHNGLSLLSLHLETGRTHQIRVHLKSIGHPLIGDFLYHPVYSDIARQALHSYRLTFVHPITNIPMALTASLPDDMKAIFPNY